MGAAVERGGRLLFSVAAMTRGCHVWRNPVRAVVMFGAIPVKDYSLASCPGLFTRAWGWRRKARATTMTAIGAISISHQTVNRWQGRDGGRWTLSSSNGEPMSAAGGHKVEGRQ